MSATLYDKRSVDTGLFDPHRFASCVDEQSVDSLFLEPRLFPGLGRINRARINREIRTKSAVDFANEFDEEFARALEARHISWLYKHRTFAVEWDDEGNFLDSFTPAFYLPGQDRYLELTAPDSPVGGTARKVSLLRRHYVNVKIDLIFWPARREQQFQI